MGKREDIESRLRGGQQTWSLDATLSDTRVPAPEDVDGDEPTEVWTPPTPVDADKRYEVQGLVGQGAMGMVYAATDLDLQRTVALKRLSDPDADAHRLRRFLTEVQVTAQLDHPNIVPVYGLDNTSEGVGYAMKLVEGRTLEALLEDARSEVRINGIPSPDNRQATRLEHFLKVCDAMSYAHSKRVIHRDLKPENIMVGRFHEIYVMDWGIARVIGAAAEADEEDDGAVTVTVTGGTSSGTRMGSIIGTPAYLSPEQAVGQVDSLDARSDIFTLGLVLYELVLLRPAFTGGSEERVRRAAAARKAPFEPNGSGEPVSRDLIAIIDRATALDPEDRYPSADALADDVRKAMRGEVTTALPDTPFRALQRLLAANSRAVLAAFVAVLVLAGAALAWSRITARAELAEQQLLAEQQKRADQAEAQAQKAALAELVTVVGSQAQKVDNHFLWYEGQLDGLAAAGLYALKHGKPVEGPLISSQDYADAERAPAGMGFSKHYNREIHPRLAVYHVPPDVPADVYGPDLLVANGLRDTLREMFLTSPERPKPPASDADRDAIILGDEVPMEWAYIAIQRSGVMYMFPGAAGWKPEYDARTRPWYRETVGTRGRGWRTPYVDLMGQGRLMSCVKALYDDNGAFLGVVGIDLEFRFLIDNYMTVDHPRFVASWLVTPQGRVMLTSEAAEQPFVVPPTEALDDGIDFGSFEHPAVLGGVASGKGGFAEVEDGVLLWAPMQGLGWSYVVLAKD